MLSLNKLLKFIPKNLIEKIDVLPTEEIDLNQRDYCHLIRERLGALGPGIVIVL